MILNLLKTLSVIVVIAFTSCKSSQPTIREVNDTEDITESSVSDDVVGVVDTLPPSFNKQLWVHRYEEDTNQYSQYYRPEKTSILPSLYRNQLIFAQDGTCQYRWLSPVDAHKMKDATWIFDDGTLYILENTVEIIDAYDILTYTDSLMVLAKQASPLDKVLGKWNLISSSGQDFSHHEYTITVKGDKVEVGSNIEILHTYAMSHSDRKLQEPLALTFDPTISTLYPWLGSGHYGILDDTLVLEIDNDMYSKFTR